MPSRHHHTFFTYLLSALTVVGGVLFSLPAVAVSTPTRGANVPWIEYEAEDGATNGEILGPSREIGNPATECCGRRGVKLTAAGQYVEIKAQKKANAIVVRYCIPDAPTGNGIDATVSMYVNGKHRQDLAVTSHHSWLYGTESVSSNTPGDGIPNRMFDECHALVGTIPAGATVRLQKDDGDTAAYYIVDLIDLEWVKPPLKKPSGFLSVTDFGATPNDTTDDAAAIEKCIAEAKAQQKGVWLPAGTFIQSHSIAASDVTVRGAGMWYTMLLHPESSPRVGGKIGFNVVNNARFSDFAIFGGAVHRDDGGNAFGGTFGTGTVIERVWMEHTNVGIWVGRDYTKYPATGMVIRDCRIRDTFADGINFCTSTQKSLMENCHARNTGDDAFAMWSCHLVGGKIPCFNNTIRNCTAQQPWKAACFALYGGYGNVIENCLAFDTLTYPGLTINSGFKCIPFSDTTTVRNCSFIRCGGTYWKGQQFGAIWVYSDQSDITGLRLQNIDIVDATHSGLMFQGPLTLLDSTFTNIRIENSGTYGIRVTGNSKGSATLTGVTVSHSAQGGMLNEAKGNFLFEKKTGNSGLDQ